MHELTGRVRGVRSAVVLLLAGWSAACNELPQLSGPAERVPTRLELQLSAEPVRQGDLLPAQWRVLDQHGVAFERLPPWAVPEWSGGDLVRPAAGGQLEAVAPGAATLRLSLAGLTATTQVRINPLELRVGVAAAYVTQGVQRISGTLPLVAERDAWLRIFLSGDQPNFFRPTVHAHFYRNGVRVRTLSTRAPLEGVPVQLEEGSLLRSWNVPVPGDLIVPGAAVLVEIEADGGLRPGAGSVLRYPATGQPLPLDARAVAPFRITFVPIDIIGFARGDVRPDNVGYYMSASRAVWPLHETDVIVREPYFTTTRSATESDWSELLRQIRTLRLVDGSTRYYHGILRREGAWAGLAYLGYPVGITRDGQTTWTVAHELGHNFGRRHAPCGNPSGVDPNYPHPGGGIGVWGMTQDGNTLLPPTHPDLMTYCSPRWVSDYNFEAVFAFRANEAARATPADVLAAATAAPAAAAVPVLIVAGEIGPSGAVLDPAFVVRAAPRPPARAGPHRLEGMDPAGAVLFSYSFDGDELGEGASDVRHFAFALPVAEAALARVARLRLSGAGQMAERGAAAAAAARPRAPLGTQALPGDAALALAPDGGDAFTLRWDARRYPLVVVRNPATGAVIAMARGGQAALRSAAAELELYLSDGAASTTHRVAVPRR
jgi:hypothetical protein